MSIREVIDKIARNRLVERLIESYNLSTPYAEDLCQDIYAELYLKDERLIVGMYERGEIGFYIRKMISNNVNSFTSPFYKNYEKYRKNADQLVDDDNGDD